MTESDTSAEGDGGDGVEDHRSYFIGESTKFDGGGFCNNADLNVVTSTFRSELGEAGWTGQRFVDENSWPEDFREGTLSAIALDGVYGDAARLSVYAGHGNIGQLQWGQPSDNGQCQNNIKVDSRYGILAGNTAAATMLMTSCTLRIDQLWPVFQGQSSRQFFGYHNSPHIGYDEARKVFKRTQDGQSTADAWLEEMVQNVSGKNSPVVLTMGTSKGDASEMHGMTNLASGEGFLENVGEPADNYFFEFYNSGCSTTCGNCSGNATAPPEVTLGASMPRITLARPLRSAANLVELASILIGRFDVGALDVEEQARLDAWAHRVVASGDVTHALIRASPNLDLSYDPQSDLLRITNRSALAQARLLAGELIGDPANLQATLQAEAEAVRDGLAAIPGALDLLGTQFEVTTREVGQGGGEGPQSGPVAFEYMFTLPGRFEDLALPDRSLGIGVTRLGELSTLTMAMVELEVVGEARIEREPQHAIEDLKASLHVQYPSALDIEIVKPQIGYVLREEQAFAEVEPSLLVGIILEFGVGNERMVSRGYPLRVSLTELAGPFDSLAALDPNPQAGDPRASN